MKKMRIVSLMLAAMLSASGLVSVAFAADESSFTATDVRRTVMEKCAVFDSRGEVSVPCKPADGDIVGYRTRDNYEGIACRCTEPDKIKPDANEKVTVQSYDKYLKSRNSSYEYAFDEETMPLNLIDGVTRETLYIVSGKSYDAVMDFCAENPALEPVGILTAHVMNPEYYYGTDAAPLRIDAADGYEIDANALNTADYHYIQNLNGWYPTDKETGKTVELKLEDAAALCEKLEARDDISFAWVRGLANAIDYPSSIRSFTVMPVVHQDYLSGDADGNGKVDLDDAITALQAYTAVNLMKQENPLTAAQFIAADTDGDGVVYIEDALGILQIYTQSLLRQSLANTQCQTVRVGLKEGAEVDCDNAERLNLTDYMHLPVKACRSAAELEAYVSAHFTESVFSSALTLHDAMQKYSEDFFANQMVLAVSVTEGSGSITDTFAGIITAADQTATVTISRQVPQTMTADMAYWLFLIEIPQKTYANMQFDAVTDTAENGLHQ